MPRRNQCGRHAYAHLASACGNVGVSSFCCSFALLNDEVLVVCAQFKSTPHTQLHTLPKRAKTVNRVYGGCLSHKVVKER